ncbi:hypothetical protein Y032_0050g1979 [Ancylostoma ceylanicum]|uniref:Uncharacterized protein n=1 Tax=Ancylostoma ceylanicum TaxID=53326 RepID=A0A016U8F4_9BILA|nr:hypothetical protein Y032_0050g1979 [Ancylostoma ceylanicum]
MQFILQFNVSPRQLLLATENKNIGTVSVDGCGLSAASISTRATAMLIMESSSQRRIWVFLIADTFDVN